MVYDSKMLAASRLFFRLKDEPSNVFRFDRELKKCLYADFSDYEINQSMKWLLGEGWVTQDKTGLYFLQGAPFFSTKYKNEFRDPRHVLCVEVERSALKTHQGWRNMVCGYVVGSIHRHMVLTTTEDDRMEHVAANALPCDVNDSISSPIPLSLGVMSTYLTGLSKATLSRIRSRAALTGRVTNVQQFDLFKVAGQVVFTSYEGFLRIREYVRSTMEDVNPDRLRYRRGLVTYQMPNLVGYNDSMIRFSVKHVKVRI